MTLVRKDPLVRDRPNERLGLKGPIPVRYFSSARRQAAFCDRVAGLSNSRSASASAALMKKVLRAFLTIMMMLVPLAAFGQTDAVDLTATFIGGGVVIDRLLVYQIGGIVVIRGRTHDPALGRIDGVKSVKSTVTLTASGGGDGRHE